MPLLKKKRVYKPIKRKKGSKKIHNAVKGSYDGVDFRSGLEIFMYKELKAAGIPFDYEKHKYTLMDALKVTNPLYKKGTKKVFKLSTGSLRPITYMPDFVGKDFVIEVKGVRLESFNLKFKLFRKYLQDNNLKYNIYMPTNQDECKQVIKLIQKNII